MSRTLVCFTGKADILGNKIDRVHLENACHALGWQVTAKPEQHMGGSYYDCILVASRDDTQKAKHAKSMGWTILTYDEFAGHLHMNGVREVGGVRIDSFAGDYHAEQRRQQEDAKASVAAKRAARAAEREQLEANPMWGAWG